MLIGLQTIDLLLVQPQAGQRATANPRCYAAVGYARHPRAPDHVARVVVSAAPRRPLCRREVAPLAVITFSLDHHGAPPGSSGAGETGWVDTKRWGIVSIWNA